jgi:hypothetical protein
VGRNQAPRASRVFEPFFLFFISWYCEQEPLLNSPMHALVGLCVGVLCVGANEQTGTSCTQDIIWYMWWQETQLSGNAWDWDAGTRYQSRTGWSRGGNLSSQHRGIHRALLPSAPMLGILCLVRPLLSSSSFTANSSRIPS